MHAVNGDRFGDVGAAPSDELGQAEIEDLDAAVARHEQVARLDIPVHHVVIVGGGQAPGDLKRVFHRSLDRNGTAGETRA